jgi:hypothetical protein
VGRGGGADATGGAWVQGHCTHSFRGHKGIVLRVLFHPEPQKLMLFTSSDDAEVSPHTAHDDVGTMKVREAEEV